VRILGQGRAGGAFARALAGVGWDVDVRHAHEADVSDAGAGTELVLLCVPDGAVASVAAAIDPTDAVVAHVAGSLGLDVLAPHRNRAAIHPLASLPTAEIGADRLVGGATFSIAGDPGRGIDTARRVAQVLDGRAIELPDANRAAYHAAAAIASNHLVALMDQVQRTAGRAGFPLDAYLPLVRQTIDNVELLGPRDALTGPAARGDEATLAAHRAVLDAGDVAAYDAMADLCRELGRSR
jgi:predicted short-subunit dehydrogenase-like oxidoreductase (DUF2520 family)